MAQEAAWQTARRHADWTAVDELPAPLTTALREEDPVVEWLAEWVDGRRPAVLRDLLGHSDELRGLRAWLSSCKTSDVASSLATVAASVPVNGSGMATTTAAVAWVGTLSSQYSLSVSVSLSLSLSLCLSLSLSLS